jgi:SAM-dependent methyltransferase
MKRALLLPLLLAACETPATVFEPLPEESVKPGINKTFLDPELNVDSFVERFEGESREVFAQREAIVEAIGLELGQDVVDVGSGTGPFLAPFAHAVGPDGKVYAVDIAQRFVDHLAQRARDENLPQVEACLCRENSIDLPAHSVDLAFICDVYHHFEFPRNSMGSIHYALRSGGEVVIVDFERIEGVSSEWVLGHVRAGKQEVVAEMESFGFDFVEELNVPGLKENWIGRFRKR